MGLSGKKGFWIKLFLAVLLLVILIASFADYYFQYVEMREIGEQYVPVFWTNFGVMIITQVVSFALAFLLFYLTMRIVKRVSTAVGMTELFINRNWVSIVLSLILALLTGTGMKSLLYQKYLMFANATQFGITDPVFSQDIGYYIFQRPFWMTALSALTTVWLLLTVVTAIAYFLLYNRTFEGDLGGVFRQKPVMLHNIINISVFFLLKAVSYKFQAENILYSSIGEVRGAGFTETNVNLLYYRIVPFLLLALVVIAMILLFRGKVIKPLVVMAVYPALAFLVVLVASVVQTVWVKPNEIALEKQYLGYNIEATRAAYDLNDIVSDEFAADNTLTAADLEKHKGTIDNIRIIDTQASLTVINQLQAIRNYYTFNDFDIARYKINGRETAVGLAAREIAKNKLDPTAKTYINEKFRFTHGFGVVMNPLNEVTTQGQPEFYIKDIPPQSQPGVPEVNQPRIYYGESTNDYVFVKSKQDEFDYASGQNDENYRYEGDAGLKMGFLNRLIYSTRYGDWKMLISDVIKGDTRMLINRNVTERVKKVAPFFHYDNDPYIIVDGNGGLKWIIDAYTYSSDYPYAQNVGEIDEDLYYANYIRNSAKATVDAYSGEVKFYIMDGDDPLVKTYQKIYPTLFEQSGLPADIMEHTRYPEYIFKIQAAMYRKYHTQNPETFYTKNDLWAFAKQKYFGDETIVEIEPYYNLVNLNNIGEDKEEMVLMIPYTLTNRDNMVAWLGVRSEGDAYGQMVVYNMPKDKNVYGPLQIENKIDNDPVISRDMSLWKQGGSTVIRGNLIVIPIEQSLLYVEPVYITSQNQASLPEVKRVIVGYGDTIVMEPTVEEALNKLFGTDYVPSGQTGGNENQQAQPPSDTQTQPPSGTQAPSSGNTQLNQITEQYNKMKGYLSSGDWTNFGAAMEELDKLINEYSQGGGQ